MTFKDFVEAINNKISTRDKVKIVETNDKGEIVIQELIPEFFRAAYDVLEESKAKPQLDEWGRTVEAEL